MELVAVALLAAALAAGAQPRSEDILILRDGSQHKGALQSCDGSTCTIGKSSVKQAGISWIGLGTRPPTPPVRSATRPELHLVNKTVVPTSGFTLDAAYVHADKNRYPRAEVAWIHIPGPAPISRGAWKGKMEYTGSGEGVTFTGLWDVTIAADAAGKLKGGLTGEETYVDAKPRCASTVLRKLTYDAVLTGQLKREHGGLALDIEGENSVPGEYYLTPPCPYKPFPWGGPNPYVLYEPAVRQMLANVGPAADGSLQSSVEWRMPANPKYLYKAKLTLRPTGK